MRHARSDSYKKARGTLKSQHSEATRAKRAVDNVLAFPQLKAIPACSFPLPKGGPGERAYLEWSEMLLKANLLTAVTVGYAEQYAVNEQKMHDRVNAGKLVTDRSLEIRRSLLLKFEALNVDRALVPDKTKPNRFAHCGFPARLRKERAEKGLPPLGDDSSAA